MLFFYLHLLKMFTQLTYVTKIDWTSVVVLSYSMYPFGEDVNDNRLGLDPNDAHLTLSRKKRKEQYRDLGLFYKLDDNCDTMYRYPLTFMGKTFKKLFVSLFQYCDCAYCIFTL